MNAKEIKLDWQLLVNDLSIITKAIKEDKIEIIDSLTSDRKPLRKPDAIVLLEGQIFPIWKEITERTRYEEYDSIHRLFPINFETEGEMSINDYSADGIEILSDITLYKSITSFNDYYDDDDVKSEMIILYIVEESDTHYHS